MKKLIQGLCLLSLFSCSGITYRVPANSQIGLVGAEGQVVLAKLENGLIKIVKCEDYTDLESKSCEVKEEVSLTEEEFLSVASRQYFKLKSPLLKLSERHFALYEAKLMEDVQIEQMKRSQAELERKISFIKKYIKDSSELPGLEQQNMELTESINQAEHQNEKIKKNKLLVDEALKAVSADLLDRVKSNDLEIIVFNEVQKQDDFKIIAHILSDVAFTTEFALNKVYGRCRIDSNLVSGLYVIMQDSFALIYFPVEYTGGLKKISEEGPFTLSPGKYSSNNTIYLDQAQRIFSNVLRKTDLCSTK